MDSEMLRNGSGYIDPTAAQAMKNMVYPGEIWTTATGKEVLILKDHGKVCTVLTLLDEEKAGCIEVVSRAKRWCNPLFVRSSRGKTSVASSSASTRRTSRTSGRGWRMAWDSARTVRGKSTV